MLVTESGGFESVSQLNMSCSLTFPCSVYVQHGNKDIVQKCWSVGQGWWSRDNVVESNAPSGCAITAIQFGSGAEIHLRIYWTGHNTDFWHWCYDSTPLYTQRGQ